MKVPLSDAAFVFISVTCTRVSVISDHPTQNRQQPFRERIPRLRSWWLVSYTLV